MSNEQTSADVLMENTRLRDRSGNIESDDPLVNFFYMLLRDHIPAGDAEGLVRTTCVEQGTFYFTNGYLAQYAADLAERLEQRLAPGMAAVLAANKDISTT